MSQETILADRIAELNATPLFSGLKKSNLTKLAAASRLKIVTRGSGLFNQHDPAYSLYILRSGVMGIVLTSYDGREMLIDELKPGDCFGEVCVLMNGERTAGAVAREDGEVIEINGDEFLSILDAEPSLVKRMLDIAMRRLFRAQKRESALAFLGAPARIARLLVEMDEADKQESDKGYITLSQEELAQRTGLTRQTVSNNLGYWRREDWLLTGRGRIMLLNRAAIRRIAEESLI